MEFGVEEEERISFPRLLSSGPKTHVTLDVGKGACDLMEMTFPPHDR